jgi:ketosteroid isomerase-like protein
MSEQNLELARSAYDAFGRGDIAAVLGALSEDVDWNTPAVLPHAKDARGREEVGQFFQGLASTWEDFAVEAQDFVASGDRVCVIGRATGKLGGTETGYGFVHAWTVRDGELARLDEYVDPDAEMLAG